ncbi:helix-turn-helix domain-containing protein [Methylobacterium sp. yr596]|uniref:helix-turn-helix domain-containing protein n=1 Tax=Methylobacterium sp. yr596 TaxID=1761800 RepID=UPI000B82694D|nr:helix-turn-helix domain-containing protein [Methylobacterium sp. yr596]
MSIAALNWALNVQTESSSQKLVLLLLANFADEQARSWPSQKVIAEKACLSVRSVVTALAELEKAGMIRREARWRPGGSRGTDIIHLSLGGPNAQNLPQSTKDAKSARLTKDAKSVDQTCKSGEGKGAKPAHLTTFEPPVEPSVTRSDANASGDPAAPAAVPALSLTDQLWMDGLAALVGMGADEKGARRQIGWWLRLTRQDPGRVLWAINEAVEIGTENPIPYVTHLLSEREDRQPARASPRRGNSNEFFAMAEEGLRALHEQPATQERFVPLLIAGGRQSAAS